MHAQESSRNYVGPSRFCDVALSLRRLQVAQFLQNKKSIIIITLTKEIYLEIVTV